MCHISTYILRKESQEETQYLFDVKNEIFDYISSTFLENGLKYNKQ